MRRPRRGLCPPFIAIGLVVIFMLVTVMSALIPTAQAAGSGGELPPPGGAWPPTTTGDTGTEGESDSGETPPAQGSAAPEETPPAEISGTQQPDPSVTDPDTVVVEPVEPTEPVVIEDPVGRYPSRLDTEGVKIVSPSLDDLLASGADLESLLYPSGLQLPTKYMDLLMCAPVSSSSNVVGETANFLKTIAPTSTGTYTFAEYEAADLYLAICRCYMQEPGESKTGDALKNLDANTTVNWTVNVTNATVSDYSKLVALISNYKSLLETYGGGSSIGAHKQFKDLVAEHKGVYYSMGDLTYYKSLADGTAPNDQFLSTYTTNLYSTWSYLGVNQSITTNLMEYSRFYNEFALNGVNYNRGAPASSFDQSDPNAQVVPGIGGEGLGEQGGSSTEVTAPDHSTSGGNIVSGTTGQDWAKPNTQGSGDAPVSSVGGSQGTDTSILPDGHHNLQDIASIIAVVFVVVGITAVWIIHNIRKGSDPLKKWK